MILYDPDPILINMVKFLTSLDPEFLLVPSVRSEDGPIRALCHIGGGVQGAGFGGGNWETLQCSGCLGNHREN